MCMGAGHSCAGHSCAKHSNTQGDIKSLSKVVKGQLHNPGKAVHMVGIHSMHPAGLESYNDSQGTLLTSPRLSWKVAR